MNAKRCHALLEKVDWSLTVNFIKVTHYSEWLANPILVEKKSIKWRICICISNLNQACPKDIFPLPRIDQLVDVMAGHELLSLMDAYSRYNQIKMRPEDKDKTTSIIDYGIYCYKVMPFGLKNTDATFQKMVKKSSRRKSDIPQRYMSMTCLWTTVGAPTTCNT